MSSEGVVWQFEIALLEIEPRVWRRIHIRSSATFWDLHCAIQDAFGWQDRHLHEFRLGLPGSRGHRCIGIPESDGSHWSASWEEPLGRHVVEPGAECLYVYDFGDDWRHRIVFEGGRQALFGQRYPVLVGGERACPPEDCGGPPGYEALLEALADPHHPDHDGMKEWLGRPFRPDAFAPRSIRFRDPTRRLRAAGYLQ